MKKNLLRNSALTLLLALFAVSPVFASAKSNGKDNGNGKRAEVKVKIERIENEKESEDDDDKDDNKKEERNERKCRVAYGHLFAFGWLKKNAAPEIEMDCFLPFGIAKKFRGGNGGTASTTPDTLAPIITDLRAATDITSARVAWNTNEKSDSAVFWSLTSPVSTSSTSAQQVFVANKVKNHSITINGLAASTTYYVVVVSKDSVGNSATSSELTFTTKPVVIVGDTTAPTIDSVVAMIGTSTAKIGWQTNEAATSKVYFGTTTPLSLTASSTSFVESAALTSAHLAQVNGLSTSTTYYMVVESKDGAGNTQRTSEFSFTTGL